MPRIIPLGDAFGPGPPTPSRETSLTGLVHQIPLMYIPVVPVAASTRLIRSTPAFRAMGDPTRMKILELLRDGERCVCELTDELQAAQSRLSFHLKILKDAGLIRDRREGRWVYYSLAPQRFERLGRLLAAFAKHQAPRSSGVSRRC